MGALYLIENHNPTLLASKINDTLSLASGYTEVAPIRGSFVVNVPFDIPLEGIPADLGDLITKKYAGILSMYPGYQNIVYNECIDSSGWLTSTTLPGQVTVGTLGSRQSVSVMGGGYLESTSTTLLSVPATAIIRWEVFAYSYTDTTGTQPQRTYQEVDPSDVTVEVTFDNGVSWNPVQSGLVFSIPFASQGSDFKLAITTSNPKVYVASWALVY